MIVLGGGGGRRGGRGGKEGRGGGGKKGRGGRRGKGKEGGGEGERKGGGEGKARSDTDCDQRRHEEGIRKPGKGRTNVLHSSLKTFPGCLAEPRGLTGLSGLSFTGVLMWVLWLVLRGRPYG